MLIIIGHITTPFFVKKQEEKEWSPVKLARSVFCAVVIPEGRRIMIYNDKYGQ
jgi:hypothetical protein